MLVDIIIGLSCSIAGTAAGIVFERKYRLSEKVRPELSTKRAEVRRGSVIDMDGDGKLSAEDAVVTDDSAIVMRTTD